MKSQKSLRHVLIAVLMTMLICSVTLFFGSCEIYLTPDEGKDGKSAYELWLENGGEGTEEDFLAWIKGEKGDKGDTGATEQVS